MGRLSHDWLTLQGTYTTKYGTYHDSYVWAASIVEISLKKFMELWEQPYTQKYMVKQKNKNNPDISKTQYIEIRQLHTFRDKT